MNNVKKRGLELAGQVQKKTRFGEDNITRESKWIGFWIDLKENCVRKDVVEIQLNIDWNYSRILQKMKIDRDKCMVDLKGHNQKKKN